MSGSAHVTNGGSCGIMSTTGLALPTGFPGPISGNFSESIGWLVVSGLMALSYSISVCIGPSPKKREKEERKDR